MKRLLVLAALTMPISLAAAQAPTAIGPRGVGLSQGTASLQLRAGGGPPRNAAEYYGLPTTPQNATASRSGGGVSLASHHAAVGPSSKPFSHVAEGPTLSPYLNLYRDETDDAIPNYYAFVRPQQRQIEMNQQQARELNTLRQRVRQAQNASPAAGNVGGRFNNTGRFYQGWNR
ncbi:MAG: hypothetical protein AAFV43_08440 [Planctomycetota bacterium]